MLAGKAEIRKTIRIHWEPLEMEMKTRKTIWNSLPKISVDKETFEKLFEVKGAKEGKRREVARKELNALPNQRMMQINFGKKKLPQIR